MSAADALREGRDAFERRAWARAYARLSAADEIAPLGLDDLERLAVSAYLIGRDEASAGAWARGHNECLRLNDVPRAVRCGFWLVLDLLNRGEPARANGWLARTRRLLDEAPADCAERGLVLVLIARTHVKEGDIAAAHEAASRAIQLADRFDDPELEVFGRLGFAQVRARRGDAGGAVALFDEIMVAVTAGDVSPIAVGVVYCAVIDGCQSLFDLGRAREWTAAVSRWCETQPDLVPFRGKCLVHRAEIMRLSGAWSQAMAEAEQACGWLIHSIGQDEASGAAGELSAFKYPVGAAFYQLAEIHRVRGDFADADAAYRQASHYGTSPQPGLGLLRMAQGRSGEAEAAVRRLLAERQTPHARAGVLAASVDVMIEARDLPVARLAADELAALAAGSDAPFLRALSAQATGSVLLAEGDARGAVAALRGAWMGWQEIEAPYEAARVRVLLGLGCRALGDDGAAELELDAARRVFERLAAAPDVARLNALRGTPQEDGAGALTPRELEVIALIATGRTNQAIAGELGISKRTAMIAPRSAALRFAYASECMIRRPRPSRLTP